MDYSAGNGIVLVTYNKRYGFLWLKKKTVQRIAVCTTILWHWDDQPNRYLFKLTDIIKCYIDELNDGKTVELKGEMLCP